MHSFVHYLRSDSLATYSFFNIDSSSHPLLSISVVSLADLLDEFCGKLTDSATSSLPKELILLS